MPATTKDAPKAKPLLPRGTMPARMRAIYIRTRDRTGAWLAEALETDSASEVDLEESVGVTAGLARLRDDAFDLVLVAHEPDELDALELVEGLRGGGNEAAILVLGSASEQEMTALCHEVGADAYLCVNTTTTRTLLWAAARAIERHELLRENRRLLQADRQRLQQEHLEADRLLAEQRALINDLESLASGNDSDNGSSNRTNPDKLADKKKAGKKEPAVPRIARTAAAPLVRLPENLLGHYRELLRAYVIMGSGNLVEEMHELAELLAATGVTPQQTMLMHLQVVEELIRGLGSRSARHVMTRADLLVLEVMIHLAEGYRSRYWDCVHPPRQRVLPGFEGIVNPVTALRSAEATQER
jgi:DNA-binding NarL/FixJ family response regulator